MQKDRITKKLHKKSILPIVLKPGPARRVDPGMGPVRVEAKTRLGIGPARPDRPGTRLTRQDPASNPLTFFLFFFLLKQRRFDFFKKKILPSDPVKTQ